MCNKPMYRLVIDNEAIEKRLPQRLKKRLVGGGIIMDFMEYTTLCNCYGLRQDNFQTIPCGSCFGCLQDYANMWTARALCESTLHKSNYFCTLTYNDYNLPTKELIHPLTGEVKTFGCLQKTDFQSFQKRFRSRLAYEGLPEFSCMYCGEYGDLGKRPHFHFLGFGLEFNDLQYFYSKDRSNNIYYEYRPDYTPYFLSKTLENAWGNGFVLVTPLTASSCSYVASYVNKQRTPKQIQLAQGSEEVLQAFNRQFDNYSLTVDNAVKLGYLPTPFIEFPRKKGLGKDFFDIERQWNYLQYKKYDNVFGKPLPKQSIRYFDNILKNSEIEFAFDIIQRYRKQKYGDKPYLQWSDYGQLERDKKEEILKRRFERRKPRDL